MISSLFYVFKLLIFYCKSATTIEIGGTGTGRLRLAVAFPAALVHMYVSHS
jgi:hypothetical protein